MRRYLNHFTRVSTYVSASVSVLYPVHAVMSDYNSTARFLAQPISPPSHTSSQSRSRSQSPIYSRRSASSASRRRQTFKQRILDQSSSLLHRFTRTYSKLSPLQRILIICAGIVTIVLGILFLVYNERIFGALAPLAKKWRNIPAGWLILWAATFFVSFPPLIGYSTCVTLAGFVFGVWKGYVLLPSLRLLLLPSWSPTPSSCTNC